MAFPRVPRVLVCGRIGDPWGDPEPGSRPDRCCDCGHAVMAGPRSTLEHEAIGTPIVCVECFARHRDLGHPVILRRRPE